MKNLLFLSIIAILGFASCNGGEPTPAEQIATIEEGMRNNPEMLATLKAKAEQFKTPLDQQIHNDAVWFYEEQMKLPHLGEAITLSGKVPSKEEIIAMKIKEIKDSPTSMADVKQKAEQFKVPVDTQILRDAIWLYEGIMNIPHPGDKPAEAPAPAAADKPAAPAPTGH